MAKTKGQRKTKVKSSRNARGVGKLGWTEGGKMAKVLSKMEKVKSLEDEIIPLNNTKDNVEDIIKLEIATGTKYE